MSSRERSEVERWRLAHREERILASYRRAYEVPLTDDEKQMLDAAVVLMAESIDLESHER
jgi:hypothetical protein